jgi:hypothetical protein
MGWTSHEATSPVALTQGRAVREESQEKKEQIHTSHGNQAPLEAETGSGVEQGA